MPDNDAPPAAEQSIPSSVDLDASPNRADRSTRDCLEITFLETESNERRRRVLETRDAETGTYDYVEGWWNGYVWKPRGHEIVTDVEIEGALPGTTMLATPDGGTSLKAIREQLEQALEEETDTRFHVRQALQLVEAAEEDSR